MWLDKYFLITREKKKAFSKRIGCSEQSISNFLSGRRKPSSTMAVKIEIGTGGKVTLHDLMEYWEAKKKNG